MKLLRSKKGFTLVEIIVVLVIIAILAAISLPALTGYITDANEKAAISEARTVWVAMQTISSTEIGKGTKAGDIITILEDTNGEKRISELTGMTEANIKGITDVSVSTDGTVTEFTYDSTPAVKFKDGELTVVEPTSSST